MRRVVVTGIGIVTPLGVGTDATWEGLVAGRSAVGPIEGFDASSLRTQLAAELDDFDATQFAPRKALRSMPRTDHPAGAGAAVAAEDAALEAPEEGDDERARRGLYVGSNKEVSNLQPILDGVLYAQAEDGSLDLGLLGENARSAFPPLYYVEGLQAAS